MQTPLKASPLGIEFHALTSIHVDVSRSGEPNWNHHIRTRRQVTPQTSDGLRWVAELTVDFGTSENSEEAAYSGSVAAMGHFLIAEQYPEEKRKALIEVTAASILYGTCREALANFTARSIHGILSLPSVAFEPFHTEPGSTTKAAASSGKKTSDSKQKPHTTKTPKA